MVSWWCDTLTQVGRLLFRSERFESKSSYLQFCRAKLRLPRAVAALQWNYVRRICRSILKLPPSLASPSKHCPKLRPSRNPHARSEKYFACPADSIMTAQNARIPKNCSSSSSKKSREMVAKKYLCAVHHAAKIHRSHHGVQHRANAALRCFSKNDAAESHSLLLLLLLCSATIAVLSSLAAAFWYGILL